jgi:cell division protein FtsW
MQDHAPGVAGNRKGGWAFAEEEPQADECLVTGPAAAGSGAGGQDGQDGQDGAVARDRGIGAAVAGSREVMESWRALFGRPLTSYYLILGITTLLLGLGLVMVLSTGSVVDLSHGRSPYTDFGKQLLGVAVGLPLMWVAARSNPKLFRVAAYPALAAAVVGLGLTLIHGVGQQVNGATRWIDIGGFQVQPAELAKLALVLWGADLLARKEKLNLLNDWRHMLVPLLPGAGLLVMLVMIGDDLGTTFILLIIFLTLLWIAGTPGRVFTGMLILMALVLLLLAVSATYRVRRLTSFIDPSGSPTGANMQTIQGRWAISSGGLFGVGLGGSREKWDWVPESTSDFIFAILGEELGLVGTLCVAVMYGGLAFAGLRVARRTEDTFTRLAAAAITTWIVIQAVVNMGAVIGILPITGVPLPLVSAGLSSLLSTMVALGVLMSFARREPGAQEALAARGPSPWFRVLSWLGLTRRGRTRG